MSQLLFGVNRLAIPLGDRFLSFREVIDSDFSEELSFQQIAGSS